MRNREESETSKRKPPHMRTSGTQVGAERADGPGQRVSVPETFDAILESGCLSNPKRVPGIGDLGETGRAWRTPASLNLTQRVAREQMEYPYPKLFGKARLEPLRQKTSHTEASFLARGRALGLARR